jgi:fatty acid desaturase
LLLTGLGIWLARNHSGSGRRCLCIGVMLIFLFTPLHETIHRTAFKTRALNEAVAFVIGVLIILPRGILPRFPFRASPFHPGSRA